MPEISLLIEGGKATAAPPLGPSLAPLGVNIAQIVNEINQKTAGFAGMKVPVIVSVDSSTKAYDISVGSPPISALIKKELKLEKGTGNPKTTFVGNITLNQVKKVAEMKIESLNSTKIESAMLEVMGACDSLGITVEGVRAKEACKKFKAGELTL